MAESKSATTNRLAGESSPYLLLHAHNPVDWYPWGPEAIEKARREDKPIFLSVGYSTCYWCHVMERESFSDPETAAIMNREFVNIKLDREERPDVDEIYMAATQILTHRGGWPNSLFLTPDLRPYYAGTYFPPERRHGLEGFRSVLADLAGAWAHRRPEVLEQAEEMAHAMRHYLEERTQPAAMPPHPGAAIHSVEALAKRFDRRFGGFGDAPKFPTPSNLLLLLDVADAAGPEAGEMLAATLDAMARGGLYDQLGGGFHRYSTDREWRVPHFEKMLYDNGFLLEIYAREHARTGSPEAARVARQTADFLAREMTSPEGAFLSAIDAETDGDEGAFYVWTRQEIDAVLGEEDATFLAPLLGFAGAPFFEGGRYVLHLPERLAEAAEKRRSDPAELVAEVTGLEARLFAARARRERPATDDKVLADWNGTAITGMAVAGQLLGEPAYIERAARAADFLLSRLRPAGGPLGPLLHAYRGGQAKVPALLADYVFLIRGLLALHQATPEPDKARWLAAAVELAEEQVERLGDTTPEGGGFYTAGESPDLLFRSKDILDGAMPSGNAVAAWNLVELWERTGDERWIAEARRTLTAFAPLVERAPDAVRTLALANRHYHRAVGGADALAAAPMDERASEAGQRQLEREEERVVVVRGALGEVEDGFRPFRLTLEIAAGWHLNANPASESYLVATEVTAEGITLRDVHYPEPQPMAVAAVDHPLAGYGGTVEIEGEVSEGAGRLLLTYQPCDATRCLPPVTQKLVLG
jgi:uncharacterized protein YyaL (SSP411 family)